MARSPTVFISIAGQIRRDTEKAVLVAFIRVADGPADLVWIPKSQIQSIDKQENQDVLMIAEWIIKEKNLLTLAVAQKRAALERTVPAVTKDVNDDIPF